MVMVSFSVSRVKPETQELPTITAKELYLINNPTTDTMYTISDAPPVLSDGYNNGFINAAVTAFAQHRPLSLKPDHFWILVMQAVATHVSCHADELRSRFVTHDGKMELCIEVPADVTDWTVPVRAFCDKIKENTVSGVADMALPKFSTTTLVDEAVAMATLMKTTQDYFDFHMATLCGIPYITLEGDPVDWRNLRNRVMEYIKATCLDEFTSWYLPIVLPVLDRIAETSALVKAAGMSADVNLTFWESFVKRGSENGSGGGTYITGWINAFFPFTGGSINRACQRYSEDWANKVIYKHASVTGNYHEEYPCGLTAVPVTWDRFGTLFDMQFCAGFVGASQDKQSLALSPECLLVVVGRKRE